MGQTVVGDDAVRSEPATRYHDGGRWAAPTAAIAGASFRRRSSKCPRIGPPWLEPRHCGLVVLDAWDVLVPNYAKVEWESFQEEKPITDPAYNHRLQWREIAARPSNAAEAWAVLSAIVAEHVGRLEELLAQNQAIEAIEDPTWADRAALDCSPAFERPRRYQSAKTRELLRTLETLRKMRNSECGMGDGEGEMADGKSQMADGKCQRADGGGQMAENGGQMAEGELQMADEQCEVEAGGCDEGQSSELTRETSLGRGTDTDAADRPGQGDGGRKCLPGDVMTPPKAPNKANLESEQSRESQELKSETTGAEGRKQSQSSQGETRRVEHCFPLGLQDPSREHPAINRSARVPSIGTDKGNEAPGATWRVLSSFFKVIARPADGNERIQDLEVQGGWYGELA